MVGWRTELTTCEKTIGYNKINSGIFQGDRVFTATVCFVRGSTVVKE